MSNETKWTKGPWELIDSGVHPGIDGGDGSSVIIWGASLEETGVHGKSRQQALANAHLIAAAPDGAALAELVMDFCGNPKGLSEAQQDELYETALQFMKKARGETP